MEKMTFKDVMKKCFGKEKNDRWHAVAMLILYGIFFLICYLVLTVGSSDLKDTDIKPTPTPTPQVEENYTYSYTVKYDDLVEEILGKRIGTKEVLVLEKSLNDYSKYVIMSGVIYKVENETQVKVDSVSSYDKYFSVDKILELVKDIEPIVTNNTYAYDVSNTKLATIFGDTLDSTNTSQVFIVKENNIVTNISLELDSYIKDVTGENHSLKVEMSYSNIGTTTDFDILVN